MLSEAVRSALEPEAAARSSCWRGKCSLSRTWRLPGQIPEIRTSSSRFPKRRPRFARCHPHLATTTARSVSARQRSQTQSRGASIRPPLPKRSDNDKYLDRRYRKAQAYEALDHLLTTALDKSETLQRRLADYHKASPELAHWLARWQGPNSAPVKSRGFFVTWVLRIALPRGSGQYYDARAALDTA
jgi:hypothetical protein